MRDPAYEDFFLRDDDGYIPATTYCKQMHQPAMDPKCLCWYAAVLLLPFTMAPCFSGLQARHPHPPLAYLVLATFN